MSRVAQQPYQEGSPKWVADRSSVVTYPRPVDQVFGAFLEAGSRMRHWHIEEVDDANFYLQALIRDSYVPVAMVLKARNQRFVFVTCRPSRGSGTEVRVFCRSRWLAHTPVEKTQFVRPFFQQPMHELIESASQLLGCSPSGGR